ncbi:hypothetical protein [Streptomyces sp. AK02-04a]|uniref:hypothetical protein n=1 Tax=Streptomyces sp. AK02-04a TaxID=3028649 RepID=UPI0029ACF4C2|nr:hypothetical protein [Streptomyces sp. AK02-04a]MDX3763644.1 hypothetical protein [Streptomyces sp. AK02-04a]
MCKVESDSVVLVGQGELADVCCHESENVRELSGTGQKSRVCSPARKEVSHVVGDVQGERTPSVVSTVLFEGA